MGEEVEALRKSNEADTADLSVQVSVEVDRDVAAASLVDLSLVTDLLVIGSRRWDQRPGCSWAARARGSLTAPAARC